MHAIGSACMQSRWCEPPDRAATNLTLEPGLAFGTGEHPTTRLCLRALAGMRLPGLRIMDYGTGVLNSPLHGSATPCRATRSEWNCWFIVIRRRTACMQQCDVNALCRHCIAL